MVLNSRVKLKTDTTENWDNAKDFIPLKGEIIVYSDYSTTEQDGKQVFVPAIKVGDGLAYVVDLPFVSDPNSSSEIQQALYNHINNTVIHVNSDDRDHWDNNISVDISEEQEQLLLFNRW